MRTVIAISPRASTRLALGHVLTRLGAAHEVLRDLSELERRGGGAEPVLLLLDARLAAPPGSFRSIIWLIDEQSPRPAGECLQLPQELERLGPLLAGLDAARPIVVAAADDAAPIADAPIAVHPLASEPEHARPHRSAIWAELERQVQILAPHELPVLILGESGTGKELIARALHEASPRHASPFVAVHCGAIPADLLESELFGHERGAFTGAHRRHVGRFEAAGRGTILLDEIGEMPLVLQVKLLRVLQERSVQRVGGDEMVPIRARILAATHRDLESMVRQGKFREDLLHRLYVTALHLPPLRERPEDLELLAALFLGRLSRELKREVEGIEAPAWQRLRTHDWPGNVRELEHLLRRAVLHSDGRIRLADLDLADPEGAAAASAERWLRRRLADGQEGSDALGELAMGLEQAARKLGITPARSSSIPPQDA